MSAHECPRIEDAAGYVLNALPDGEWESFRYHVAECDQCTEKASELNFVSHAMLSAVTQLSAPPEIRNRVMSVVRAESELLLASGADADRPVTAPTHRRGFHWPRLRPLSVVALASVLLALGLGVGTMLESGGASCSTRSASVDEAAGAGATAKLKVCGTDATLAMSGMNAPPDGRIFELWLDDPNDRLGPQPAGLFSVRNGRATVDVGALEGRKTVLVTDEPSPNGSEVPTRRPVVRVST